MTNPRHALVNGVMQTPMPQACMEHLARVAAGERDRLGRPLDILEVGSLFGESASVLARFGSVLCLDLFEHGLERFLEQTKGLNVKPWLGNSVDLMPTAPDASFDLIFIDGDHAWPVVDADLRQAKRLVRPGGVICGDDLERVLASEKEYNDIVRFRHVPYLDAEGYHPGVSCAVFFEFGPGVEARDRFWWVRS